MDEFHKAVGRASQSPINGRTIRTYGDWSGFKRLLESQSPINGQTIRTKQCQTLTRQCVSHKALSTGELSGP